MEAEKQRYDMDERQMEVEAVEASVSVYRTDTKYPEMTPVYVYLHDREGLPRCIGSP